QRRQTKFPEKFVMPCRRLKEFALNSDEFGMSCRQIDLCLRLRRADIAGDVQIVVVLNDFLHLHASRIALQLRAVSVSPDNELDVPDVELISPYALFDR